MQALPVNSAPSSALESAFLRRQCELLMGIGVRGAIASLGILAGIWWVFEQGGRSATVEIWGTAMLITAVLRIVAARHASADDSDEARLWAAFYSVAMLVSALLWGLASTVLGRGASYELNLFLAFALAAVATGAVTVLSPLLWLYRAHLALVLIPTAIDYISRDNPFYHPLAVMMVMGAFVMEAIARSHRDALYDAWQLAGANQNLVENLNRTNTALVSTNARMLEETVARERSEARFRDAFAQSSIGMAFFDGRCLREPNNALISMLASTASALDGRPLAGMLSTTLAPAEQALALEDLTLNLPREYAIDADSGEMRWFEVSFASLAEVDVRQPNRSIVQFIDVTDAREMSTRLLFQAGHDELTGLINRREFEARLEIALDNSRESGVPHAVCYFDLDQFKVVNDTCGHAAGDQLLRQIASTLVATVRKTDTIARMGGDEFVLLMEHCTVEQAQRTAQAVRKALEDITFSWGEKRFRVSASIGLVPVTSGLEKVADILSAADSACFVAKEMGRNRVHVYGPSDKELTARQGEMAWIERINRAIDDDRLELFYQPIEPAVRGERRGMHIEVLVRLREEDGRLIPPGAFLPPAERYHIITRIDRWVVERMLQVFAEQSDFARRIETCGINLSGQSLSNDDFFEFVRDAMLKLGPQAARICFEITETAAIANIGAAETFMRELRALGCKFALDDFGSGLSSFGYLKQLPVDHLKIDGVFIRDLLTDPVDYALVRAINEVGQTLGKTTIAEFVENDQIREKLVELGVNCVQGYGIGRPRPLLELLLAEPA
jgi:diguanylate cyclase (GGDEF)-like protein